MCTKLTVIVNKTYNGAIEYVISMASNWQMIYRVVACSP